MKYKFILLIFLILLLSGCKAVYNLEIKNADFKEKISISSKKSDLKYFIDNKFYAIMNGVSNFVEYDKKVKKNNVFFSHTFNVKNYGEATVLKTCFDAYNVVNEKGYYIVSTSKGIKCSIEEDAVLLDDLDVVIKSNHKLKETNADIIDDYKYTWHFNKDNYKDGNVYIKLYKNKYVFNYENEFTIQVIIIAVFVLTILISTFIIIRRVKKAEKV